jgi:hypothetical protein
MRLRRIEASKSASAAPTSSTASSTKSTTTRSSAESTRPSTHHSAEHPHHCVRYVCRRSTLTLRLCNCILHPLPNVIFVEVRQPIGLSYLPAYRYRFSRRRVATQSRQSRHLRACVRRAYTRIGRRRSITSHAQRLRPTPQSTRQTRSRGAFGPSLLRLLLSRPRSQLQSKLRYLLRLAAILSSGINQYLFRLRRKRRQLRPHDIPSIARNRHRKSAGHIRCCSVLLAG